MVKAKFRRSRLNKGQRVLLIDRACTMKLRGVAMYLIIEIKVKGSRQILGQGQAGKAKRSRPEIAS